MTDSRPALAVGFFLLAAFCIVGARATLDQDDRLASRGVVADATVTKAVDEHKQKFIVVAFNTTTGQEVTAVVEDWPHLVLPRVGDVVQVRYDPQDPQGVIQDARRGPHRLGTVLALIGAAVAIAAALLQLVSPRWRRRLPFLLR